MAAPRPSKTHIGNHALKPETLMLGYGYDPRLSEGAVKPPVFLTSTFVFRSAEEGRDFFDYVSGRKQPPQGSAAGLVYSRFNHPNSEIVEDRLAVYEGARVLRAVLVGHVGDHHDDPGLRPARRRHPAFPAALRRHGNAAVAHHGKSRHRRRRLRRRRERARHSRPPRKRRAARDGYRSS